MSGKILSSTASTDSVPTISVVIPCFNQAGLLNQALASLVEQQWPDLEVIVVDDGSDLPIELSQNDWPFQLILFRQVNRGLAAARNKGLELANGELIKFLDADDILLPGCLEAQFDSMAYKKNSISVIGFLDHSLSTNEKREIIPAFGDPFEALLIQNIAPIHSYLFNRIDLISIGGFYSGDRTQGGCEDYDLLLRLVISGVSYVTVHKIGVVYFRYAESMSSHIGNMQRTRAAVWAYNVENFLSMTNQVSPPIASAMLAGWWQLRCKTPKIYQPPLRRLEEIFLVAIERGILRPEEAELPFLLQKLMKDPEVHQIASALSNSSTIQQLPQIHIPAQAIVDRRLLLTNFKENLELEWLCRVITAAKMAEGRFAIYGAGDIGKRVLRILLAADLVPAFFVDKAAIPETYIESIQVITPKELSLKNLNLIIIASSRFYHEIKDDLISQYENVEIL